MGHEIVVALAGFEDSFHEFAGDIFSGETAVFLERIC